MSSRITRKLAKFTTTMLLSVSVGWSMPAAAGLILTFSDDGMGGTLADLQGSGQIGNASFQTYIDGIQLGDFLAPGVARNVFYSLAQPLQFGAGLTVDGLHLDNNRVGNDDLRIRVSAFSPTNFAYSVSGTSAVTGLAFSDLLPGTYAASTHQDIGIVGGLQLIVQEPLRVLEPDTVGLLIGGLGLLLLRRRRATTKTQIPSL